MDRRVSACRGAASLFVIGTEFVTHFVGRDDSSAALGALLEILQGAATGSAESPTAADAESANQSKEKEKFHGE